MMYLYGRGDCMGIMTVKQAAEKWGVKQRRVQEIIRSGRVPAAYKLETIWVMPDDTQKPIDLRLERKCQREKENEESKA